MSSLSIQSNYYYVLSSDLYGPYFQLDDGLYIGGIPDNLTLSNETFSSDNWQIFYQNPIYLIRNFNHGVNYQLGITETSPASPQLLPASGELTQQWNITLRDNGTYGLANIWLETMRSENMLLGVDLNGNNVPIPVINAAQKGINWTFSINIGPATFINSTSDLLHPVPLQKASTSTSTSTSFSTSASTAISTPPARTTATAITSTAESVSSSSSSASSQSIASRSISGGAIAGIVIGVVAAALVLFGLLFFVWRRRQQQRHAIPADQMTVAHQHNEPRSTTMQEAHDRPHPSELGILNEREETHSLK